MSPEERFALIDQLSRCQVLLGMLRDPGGPARKTIADLITFLETKLAAMDRPVQ